MRAKCYESLKFVLTFHVKAGIMNLRYSIIVHNIFISCEQNKNKEEMA